MDRQICASKDKIWSSRFWTTTTTGEQMKMKNWHDSGIWTIDSEVWTSGFEVDHQVKNESFPYLNDVGRKRPAVPIVMKTTSKEMKGMETAEETKGA
jgi:hypothetical protein